MNFELVELSQFSGDTTTIYSAILEGDENTLLDRFILENEEKYPHEISDILQRLTVIGTTTGARQQFFKEWEGKPGDGVCALYDNPDSNLRLYCIRYGSCAVIIGGGGYKSKSIRAFQEDPKLTDENTIIRTISEVIIKAIKDKDIRWSSDGMNLIGDLKFTADE